MQFYKASNQATWTASIQMLLNKFKLTDAQKDSGSVFFVVFAFAV